MTPEFEEKFWEFIVDGKYQNNLPIEETTVCLVGGSMKKELWIIAYIIGIVLIAVLVRK